MHRAKFVIWQFRMWVGRPPLRVGTFTQQYLDRRPTTPTGVLDTPFTAFRPPYQDKNGNICVQRINTPMRTNLVVVARLFLDTIVDGSITNRPMSELRALTRVYRNGVLSVASETDGPDEIIARNFAYFSREVAFLPLCVLDAESRPDGTNTCFFVMARYDCPNDPSYARSIGMRPLVYSNGYWSLCF